MAPMKPSLDQIRTIVVVMMENRSFDHFLGYLSLPPYNWPNVNGIKTDPEWVAKASSLYNGTTFPPFPLTDPFDAIDADPPHERDNIAVQMGDSAGGVFPMNGFVTNYALAKGAKAIVPESQPPVMGYFGAKQIPVIDFFAQNFAICDHWFSSLPGGTQPNRLMAMSGFSKLEVNQLPLPEQDLIYDWLTQNGIRWRVYHQGMPFFGMMLKWLPSILTEDHFRPLERFYDDVQNEPPGEFPQVIFVEPTYTDAPHLGESSDDHAPSAVKPGQEFLLEVYRCISRVPDVWNSSVMIVSYDEHGGFFDHVSPPAIPTLAPTGINYKEGAFQTLGVRVPGIVVSPFVSPKTVHNEILDHTSILKFIGQKFGKNGSYSDLVDKRPVGSVFDILNESAARPAPIIPSLDSYLAQETPSAGFTPGTTPDAAIPKNFQVALDNIRNHPDNTTGKFADLLAAFPPRPDVA